MEARGGRHHNGNTNGHNGLSSGHNRHANGGGFGHNNNKRAHRGGGGGGGGRGHGHHGHGHSGGGGGGYSHGQHGHHGHGTGGRGSFWFKGEGYNDFDAVSIEEDVVGIHGFLSPEQPGFKGLVKQRYSDFVVHEIAANGQPVELTALVAKKRTIQASFVELVTAFAFGETTTNETAASATTEAPAADLLKLIRQLAKTVGHSASKQSKRAQEALESYNHRRLVQLVARELGAKMGGEFEAFLDKVKTRKQAQAEARAAGISADNAPQNRNSDLQFFVAGLHEKSDRVFIHETMRRFGKSLIVADTITSPDQSQVIRIRPAVAGPPKKGERDPRRDWPVDKPDYLQFVVYKRNKDIVAVLNQIAAVVKVNPSLFSFAEAKDKRGITTQLCTAFRVAKERFQAFVRLSSGRNMDEQSYLVGNLKYVTKKLSLGDCGGNAFSIVLRGIPNENDLTKRALQQAVESWRARGFINFFGIQRFGSSATPHHILGRAMLRKDFKLAVLLLLRPQDGEASKIRQARDHFRQHKDVAAALRMLPPFLIPERAVLEGLLQHGLDANELAFRSIPVHLRLAYVESYQHYVWNQMASARVEQLSRTSACVGDLVLAKDDDVDADADTTRRRVTTLTAETVGEYTIHDVVLPLPGFQVTYPSNAVGTAYQKLLAMDGVDFAAWASATQSANHHPYDVKGSYRHVVKTPQDVRYEVQKYADSNQPLLVNDVDKLQGRTVPLDPQRPSLASPVTDAVGGGADAPRGELDKDKKPTPGRALLLHFRLDYGSDATIAVRELLKQSSSIYMQLQKSSSETKDGAAIVDKATLKTSGGPASTKSGDTLTGKKRPSTTVLAGNKIKEVKVAATQKKTQVSIGRPGFSLGKGH